MYEELIRSCRACATGYVGNCDSCMFSGEDCYKQLHKASADAIEELTNRNVGKWIPVTERLPEQGKRYLVIRFDEVTKTQFIDILWHDAHDLWWNRLYKGQYNVTHWIPLPEPPKEE